jgi:uroporphyrinogen III methyltransferase/synthase
LTPQITKSQLQTPAIVPGVVYLVGAGPGDPGLLTLRGADLLALADCVVYDALVNPRLLTHAPRAEKIYVGKRAAAHSMTQEQINSLLIHQAKAGKFIVRLKGGDPFVFGRGGEECEALAAEGLRFEVVPGITAAIAAPAYAGIPVTHRDFNSSFTFLTGHEKEEQYQEAEARTRVAGAGSDIDWVSIAKLPCVAFYMGVKSLPRICSKLIEHGLPPATPAATIQSGTTSKQKTVVGTVGDLPARVLEAGIKPPALTIIGKVVSLRETMNWFESRPLFGQTILVTRARDQASELSTQLEALGANVLEAPAIELVPVMDTTTLIAALQQQHDWIIFTSINGVRFTKLRLFELGLDVRVFAQSKVAAIGKPTADAIHEQLGLRVDVCPERFVAEALADELIAKFPVAGKRFLLLRADIARPLLKQRLDAAGAAAVLDIPIYETQAIDTFPAEVEAALKDDQFDWITFTSSSTVKNFLNAARQLNLTRAKFASIGPITTATLKENGLVPTVEAAEFTVPGLVEAIKNYHALNDSKKPQVR